jgi:hypothetical protein
MSDLEGLLKDSCTLLGGDADAFPCNMNMISVASMGLATGGASLLFVFYLIKTVGQSILLLLECACNCATDL